jgi:putative transposase
MTTPPITNPYKRHRFPAEIISHCVWLYFRFSLSYREVQEMMAERGLIVSHEAVRYWGRKFGQGYANQLRRRRPRPGDTWHMDEVFLTINGARHYLWRAVDQDDNVLDILVQSRRNKKAAKKFFRKLLKGLTYVPRVVITDKLKSYAAAKREVMPSVEHRQSRYLNNRCENSHRPTRERERRMQRFKSPGHAQRFLSAYGPISQHFRPRRHLLCASEYRRGMRQRFQVWREITGTEMMANDGVRDGEAIATGFVESANGSASGSRCSGRNAEPICSFRRE